MFFFAISIASVLLASTLFADDDYFGRKLWQAGQFRERGKVNWRMPEIDVLLPYDGQVGSLRQATNLGNARYFVVDVIDEWTVIVGVAVPAIIGSTVGSVTSAGVNNVLPLAGGPTAPEIDAEFICRMQTSGLSKGQQFNPNRLFCVSGTRERRGRDLLELELLYAPCERQALSFVSAQLRENRIWSDSTGTFKVTARLVGLDDKIRLEKVDGNIIEIDRQKLSALNLNYISREEIKLDATLKVLSNPVMGIVQDDVYQHVYGFDSLDQLDKYWRSEPLNPDLTEEDRTLAGITLIPVASKVEVRRTYRIADDAIAIEVTNDAHERKILFICTSQEKIWH